MAVMLLSQRNFQLLWGGQFISDICGQLTMIALLVAVGILLGATPMQDAALKAVECASFRSWQWWPVFSSIVIRAGR